MAFTASSTLPFDIRSYVEEMQLCIPHCFRKSFVTFAENSGTPFEDISTGTQKVTKIRRKALHNSFERVSFVSNYFFLFFVQLDFIFFYQ